MLMLNGTAVFASHFIGNLIAIFTPIKNRPQAACYLVGFSGRYIQCDTVYLSYCELPYIFKTSKFL